MIAIPRIIPKWSPLLVIAMLVIVTDPHLKLKLQKFHGSWIIIFYVSQSSPQLQFRFKENAKILSKNSTTQGNSIISRLKEDFKLEIKVIIENLQDELYKLEKKEKKQVLNLVLMLNRSWRAKSAPKCSSWKIAYTKSSNIWVMYWW